jgi:hypothetical protein
MVEFSIKDQKYSTSKMDVFKQAQVMRKLLPIVASLTGLAKMRPQPGQPLDAEMLKESFEPIANALASLSDEHFQYILENCVKVVKRADADRWVSIWNAQANTLQYNDLDLMTLIQIIAQVVAENLGGFFPDALSSLPARQAKGPTPT